MIDILRQLNTPRTGITGRDGKQKSGCHTKEYSCLMDEKKKIETFLKGRLKTNF